VKRALTALVAVLLVVPMGWRLSGPKAPRFPYGLGPARSVVPAGFTEWSVEVEPGVKLRAVRRTPSAADASWMLLIHGNDAAQLETGAALLTRLEADPAVGLATYAFRGFDGSPGTPSRDALYADAAAVVKALVPGGHFVLVAYTPAQLQFDTGGPKSLDLLLPPEVLKPELTGLEFERFEVLERDVQEGDWHRGKSAVVQLLARNNASA
jgi:hypothetical protein